MKRRIPFETVVWREEPRASDEACIMELIRSSGFFSTEEVKIAAELVRERVALGKASGYYFLFAEIFEEISGYSCYGPVPGTAASYDLYWIAVKNDVRELGLGRAILEKTEQRISESGGKRIYIETSSRDLYAPTRVFYEKCGYVKKAVIQDFYSPGDDKIIYVKFYQKQGPDSRPGPDMKKGTH